MIKDFFSRIVEKVRYPKLLLLLLTFIAAYFFFATKDFEVIHSRISALSPLSAFIAGVLYVYGFSAGFATSVFMIIAEDNSIWMMGLIAGIGSVLGDLVIFRLIRESFADEIKKLSEERLILHIHHRTPDIFKRYLLPLFAVFIIASPLPDEIGVAFLAASTKMSTLRFSIISYVLNTAGIFVILYIGSAA
jgi:uncharacterized membrane protein YdjX (TVP38/TMEM64 family)